MTKILFRWGLGRTLIHYGSKLQKLHLYVCEYRHIASNEGIEPGMAQMEPLSIWDTMHFQKRCSKRQEEIMSLYRCASIVRDSQ